MNDPDRPLLNAVNHSAGWNDEFAMGQSRKFRNPAPALWKGFQLIGRFRHPVNQGSSRITVLQSNVSPDFLQLRQSSFGPLNDQANHLAIRCLAMA